MALAPQYRVEDPIEYISRHDSAFDLDRFDNELEDMREKGEDSNNHPVLRYFTGKTRFSLKVDNIKEYFDEAKEPVVFEIKRLNRRQHSEIKNMIDNNKETSAQELAFQFGVKDISEKSLKLEGPQTKNKFLTDADLDRIENAFGRDIFYEVGQAVLIASSDLTAEEKKA